MTLREIDADVCELTVESAPALLWMFVIGVNGAALALLVVESWWASFGLVAAAAAVIAVIHRRSRRRVHTIDRRFGRITIAERRGQRELSRRELGLRFVRDVVLDQQLAERKDSDGNTYQVPLHRAVYEMQDGSRVPWSGHYTQYTDQDFAVVDRVRAALGLTPRPVS